MPMLALKLTPNDLIATWTRFDWRESFFAPGIVILQALVADGRTVSGAGRTRDAAFARCLGETAELHALAAGGVNDFVAVRDGLAAHPDGDEARLRAIFEAFERQAVRRWWRGGAAAQPLSEEWLDWLGLDAALAQAREGAALKRRTGWWRIATDAGPCTVICRSMSTEGQDPILGFGCDMEPARAADKALQETLLMEMNLMELLAARSSGDEAGLLPLRNRIAAYARRCPALLPANGAQSPVTCLAMPEAFQQWFGAPVACRDVTPAAGPMSVWLCQPQTAPPNEAEETESPFL